MESLSSWQCTWGVKEVAPWASNWWGNGGDWAGSAASQGYAVGSTPVTGSIVCWTDGGYGHVGYVTQVDQDGQIQILESNYQGQQQINNYRGCLTHKTQLHQVQYLTFIQVHKNEKSVINAFLLAGRVVLQTVFKLKMVAIQPPFFYLSGVRIIGIMIGSRSVFSLQEWA